MLASLLKPCHARLTARCWHKHGRLAWFGAPAHLRSWNGPQKLRRHSKSCCSPISTTCAATEQQQIGVDQDALQLLERGMSWQGRSLGCGQLREAHIGQSIAICGWVHRNRGLGGKLFCDVRDSTGILQVLLTQQITKCASSANCQEKVLHAVRWSASPQILLTSRWRNSEASMLFAYKGAFEHAKIQTRKLRQAWWS